jgi:hypothetical protein
MSRVFLIRNINGSPGLWDRRHPWLCTKVNLYFGKIGLQEVSRLRSSGGESLRLLGHLLRQQALFGGR